MLLPLALMTSSSMDIRSFFSCLAFWVGGSRGGCTSLDAMTICCVSSSTILMMSFLSVSGKKDSALKRGASKHALFSIFFTSVATKIS